MKNTLLLILTLGVITVFAQQPRIYSTEDGAIQGYDPVAYFKQGKPMKGIRGLSHVWKEATWYFTSEENLNAFKESPGKYAPQYGGYCAFGASRGYKASTKPEAFTIHHDKLYLNYNEDVVK